LKVWLVEGPAGGSGGEVVGGIPVGICGGRSGRRIFGFETAFADGIERWRHGVESAGASGGFLEVLEVFFEHTEESFFGEGFGKDVVHAWKNC
jgi:hypothetical protein